MNIEKEVQIVVFDSIRELLFNVVKHSEVSQAFLTYEIQDKLLCITVEDRGIGFNLNDTLSGHQFGLLYTIRRIQLIGGNINIETKENVGSKITIEFPIQYNMPLKEVEPIRVLIVDDHIIVREGIRLILEQQDDIMVIGEATNIFEILEILNHKSPDIILMDISLGKDKSNGIEITKQLRENGYNQRIIVLSSYDFPHFRRAMHDLDISDYLIKGNDTNQVFDSIRKSVKHSKV